MITIEVKINGIVVGQIAGPEFNSRSPDDQFQIITRTATPEDLARVMGYDRPVLLWSVIRNVINHAALAETPAPAIETTEARMIANDGSEEH